MPLRVLEFILGIGNPYSAQPELQDSAYPHRLFCGSTLHSYAADLELMLGLLLARFLTIGVIGGGLALVMSALLSHTPNWSAPAILACAAAWLVLSKLELESGGFLSRVMEFPEPRPVHLALSQKRFDMSLRVPLALWWLAHAATALLLAEAFKGGAMRPEQVPEDERLFLMVVNWGILFGSAYASNTYVVLGLGALFPSEFIVRWMWRLRLALDVLMSMGTSLLLHRLLQG